MTLHPATSLRILALCAPLLSTQALASAMNEYTLSPEQMGTTVTTYQPSYQAQPSYQTQPVQPNYQPQPMAPDTPQFGEIVYDTEPYMPNANATDGYALQPYSGDAPLQPTYAAPVSN